MKRSGTLRRRTRLAPMSAKRVEGRDEYLEAPSKVVSRDGYECSVWRQWPEVLCYGPVDPHHIWPQSRYPELRCSPDNIRLACRAHHDAIHNHPMTARARGLLK